MSKPEYTPGPWKVDFGHPQGLPGGISQQDAPHKPVTRFNSFARPSTREAMANAHLISAAPEMYEALREALHHFEPDEGIAKAISAALLKAEGRS